MQRRSLFAAAAALALLPFARKSAAATPVPDKASGHRVAFHVDVNDPAVMNLTLNNIGNVSTAYSAANEPVQIELVAYGPGLHMLRSDTSPVAARIKSMTETTPHLALSACGNTRAGMAKSEGKEIPLLPQAKVVPAGVVRLIELQEQGWSYIRP
ncbi:MAG TPA: DsrE family protein [Candidatus Cybelea sp.]|nr:DsrE family protein [Candidatus Cybelea sp.]